MTDLLEVSKKIKLWREEKMFEMIRQSPFFGHWSRMQMKQTFTTKLAVTRG